MKILKSSLLALLVSAAPAAAQMVLDQEPARGMLKAGQTVYVKCGPSKARMITGGSNVGRQGQTIAGAQGRQKGPCVPFKG